MLGTVSHWSAHSHVLLIVLFLFLILHLHHHLLFNNKQPSKLTIQDNLRSPDALVNLRLCHWPLGPT
jgi:hypothetical protein